MYFDQTSGNVQYEKYTRTGGFQCINKVIGPWSNNQGSCGTCDRPTYVLGGASTCLRQTWAASIAYIGNNTLIITYSTPGSGSCNTTSETRIYQSTDLGSTWTFQLVTGCNNSLQPRATVSFGTNPSHAHVVSMYAPKSSAQLSQVDWVSSDWGATWSGTYVTSGRNVSPLAGCYWGDYEGAAWDRTNSKVFYDWNQSPGAGNWVIDGLTITP